MIIDPTRIAPNDGGPGAPLPLFGVFKVFGAALMAYRMRALTLTLLAAVLPVASLPFMLTSTPTLGPDLLTAPDAAPPIVQGAVGIVLMGLWALAGTVLWLLVMALIVAVSLSGFQAAPPPVGNLLKRVGAMLQPVVGLSFLVIVLSQIGSWLLVQIPGTEPWLLIFPSLFVAMLLAAFIPALVVERCGFDAFHRSISLTKGYWMEIVGVLLLVGGVTVLTLIFSLMAATSVFEGTIPVFLAYCASQVVGTTLIATSIAMTYARLVYLKEGRGMASIAAAFDTATQS